MAGNGSGCYEGGTFSTRMPCMGNRYQKNDALMQGHSRPSFMNRSLPMITSSSYLRSWPAFLLAGMLFGRVAIQPLSAQDKGVLSEEVRQAIRQELAAAKFAPVRSSPGSPTVHQSFAAYRGWLHRVLVAPMKARSVDKPWAAEAAAFADAAMEALYCQRFVTDEAAAMAGRARTLLAAGADDPVVLWLVVDILSKEKDDVSEARAQ